MASKFDKAREAIRTMGYTITRRPDGEFRVNVKDGTEATAYYTHDLDDAISTVRYEVTNGRIESATRWHREVREIEGMRIPTDMRSDINVAVGWPL